VKNKIATLQSEFEGSFKERHDEIAGALLGVLSGEHLLLLGPPGTAKSLLASKVCDAVEGGHLFYYLLTRFTTPEEIFGPLSLQALEQDRYSRKTEGYLPESHIAFLDEIFKANSSILNSLLTLLNERKFHNGQEVVEVPLLSVFGASNELPEEEEGLEALYDRFLIRYVVGNVQDETNFRELVLSDVEGFQPSVRLKLSEIDGIQTKSRKVKVDEDVQNILVELRKLLA
jgi:MoxR-like ATPase